MEEAEFWGNTASQLHVMVCPPMDEEVVVGDTELKESMVVEKGKPLPQPLVVCPPMDEEVVGGV